MKMLNRRYGAEARSAGWDAPSRWIAVLAFVLLPAVALADDAPTPDDVVQTLQNALLESMRNGAELGYRGRYELLEPIVERTHDLDYIAEFSLRRYWRELDETQRAEFTEKFTALSVSTYAGRFKEYHGERFETLALEQLAEDRVVVEGQLVREDGPSVEFEYLLRRNEAGWRIVNIIVDGVSDLALKRAEYSTQLSETGFSGLIEHLNTQIEDNEEKA